MITGINYLRIFSVMITDWETNFKDVQANDFGNLGKNDSGSILVGNRAVIFTEINSPAVFSVGNVCVDNGRDAVFWNEVPKLHWPLSFSAPKLQRFKWERLQDINANRERSRFIDLVAQALYPPPLSRYRV